MEENQKEQDENSSTDEEEIDIRSENFNPLKALYSNKTKNTKSDQKFDNVAVSFS
jgi:hypothetical protein